MFRAERERSYLGPFEAFSHREIEEFRIGYHAAIAFIDLHVGRVLKALQDNDIAENTLVLFLSDHGDMLGDHGLPAKGASFYDPCVRVPLIARWPGSLEGGDLVTTPCQPHDVAATVLAAAGLDREAIRTWMPDSCDLRRREALNDRGYAVCAYRNSMIRVNPDTGGKEYDRPAVHATMWREGRFKLNLYHGAGRTPDTCEAQLFDMNADPLEMHNLWSRPPQRDICERLLLNMANWLTAQDFAGRRRGADAMPTDPDYALVGRLR